MTIIIDSNVLISAAILKGSISDQAVRKAFFNNIVIRSEPTTWELIKTLKKEKFDRYFRNEYERDLFTRYGKPIEVSHHVDLCRDQSDNKYLELALSGKADCIITGGPDLLVLNPFKNTSIITPKEFLDRYP